MNVLLIGNGGREHALAYTLRKSKNLKKLFITPGNPGTAELGTNVLVALNDHQNLIDFCKNNDISLVVVGPEAPLVDGIADFLQNAGIATFGPSQKAAQLEGSKDFTKSICDAAKVPTAAYETFTNKDEALAYIAKKGAPIVVKYDGLMAGKGVTVAQNVEEAQNAINSLYENEKDAKVVIEEMLEGEEVSFFCFVDGEEIRILGSAQDHKRAFDGDEGPNTGGMGAYSPAPMMSKEIEDRVINEIIKPSMKEMVNRNMPYRGILFAGLMLTKEGPKLIEYNCRFGDPECQVLLLRLESDLTEILHAVATGRLKEIEVSLKPVSTLGIVMAAKGYPGDYERGSIIHNISHLNDIEVVKVFHAGTRNDSHGHLLANGGRVLTICAEGNNLLEAKNRAYEAIKQIDWKEGFYRKDIGARGLAQLESEPTND